ncbi:MAG TPA: GDP-mannose 4,6-dehydratase [Gemmatimonas sp.]|nr:GDP-mannose 4,6-dehydratase [Gemmatimonas sp.]
MPERTGVSHGTVHDEKPAEGQGVARALVTGAGGFVGAWLTAALRRQGTHVVALATDALPGHDASLEWHYGDLRDDRYVEHAVLAARPDVVVHLAAVSHVPTAAADPALAWDVNVTSTVRLLHHLGAARSATGIDPTVLIVGSAEQYGRHDAAELPLTEDAVQAPRTVYAATKAAQETAALQVERASGMRIVAARSFNHSGRGQEARFVLPALVARAVALRTAPEGTPMVLGNTTPVRDFLHVSDVVAAYISLCRLGASGEAYNVASGIGWSVAELVQRVLSRVGVSAPLTEDPALVRPVDVPALVGDSQKLQRATGWRVTQSIDDIIDDLIHAATH